MKLERISNETKKQYAERLLSYLEYEVSSVGLNYNGSDAAFKRKSKIEKELLSLIEESSYRGGAY